MIYMPLWILYWFPISLVPNCVIKGVLVGAVLLLCRKRVEEGTLPSDRLFVKLYVLTMAAEVLGLLTLAALERHLPAEFCDMHYMKLAALAFFVTVFLNLFLNYTFGWNRVKFTKPYRFAVAVLLAVLTAPYLFVILHP
ncbi:MAG: hypothetical protein IKU81_02925 [Oscillibacter sp.]|nr:hypothetical protein [Oscillibacter sp.]